MGPDDSRGSVARLSRRDESVPLLVCFPEAGRGPTAFDRLVPYVLDAFEVVAIRLPGREVRHREAPYTSMQVAAAVVAAELETFLVRPHVFLGQSLGAILAFEVMRSLPPQVRELALALVCVSEHAPHRHARPAVLGSRLTDAEFLADPERVSIGNPMHANRELRDLMLPTYRADCSLLETYRYAAAEPLPCAITAVIGADEYCGAEEALVRDWKDLTRRAFRLRRLAAVGKPFEREDLHAMEDLVAELLDAVPPSAPVRAAT
jgi:medium-chain acyl-[acyl-carrier-protein] hydrolase